MINGNDFIEIEDYSSIAVGQQGDFVEIESGDYTNNFIPKNDSFDSFVKPDAQESKVPDSAPSASVDTVADSAADGLADGLVSSGQGEQVEDQDIIPKDNTDWSARAVEITDDLNFLGYTQEQIKSKDDFYIVQEQMEFVRNEMDNNQELSDIIGRINMPPINFLESEIRSSLGVFATDDDVANKLSTFLTEEGLLNDNGNRIYEHLKSNAASKAQDIVDNIKYRSAEYAKSNFDFYRKIEESVVNFSYPDVSFEVNGAKIDLPIPITSGDKRKLYSFMQNGYTDVANGEGSEDRAKFLAENAFLLNRDLFKKFISEVARNAYQKGESETLKQIKR